MQAPRSTSRHSSQHTAHHGPEGISHASTTLHSDRRGFKARHGRRRRLTLTATSLSTRQPTQLNRAKPGSVIAGMSQTTRPTSQQQQPPQPLTIQPKSFTQPKQRFRIAERPADDTRTLDAQPLHPTHWLRREQSKPESTAFTSTLEESAEVTAAGRREHLQPTHTLTRVVRERQLRRRNRSYTRRQRARPHTASPTPTTDTHAFFPLPLLFTAAKTRVTAAQHSSNTDILLSSFCHRPKRAYKLALHLLWLIFARFRSTTLQRSLPFPSPLRFLELFQQHSLDSDKRTLTLAFHFFP